MTTMTPQVKAAETRRLRREQLRRSWWESQIFPIASDLDAGFLMPCQVIDGDWATALEDTIQSFCEAMTVEPNEFEQPVTTDVALCHQGRILAVIQYALDGPVVTRLKPTVQY
jgi:hypothetical protein